MKQEARIFDGLLLIFIGCIAFAMVGFSIKDHIALNNHGIKTTVFPASNQYTERKKYGIFTTGYSMDLQFLTADGEKVILHNSPISKEELESFKSGKVVQREYLPEDVHITRQVGDHNFWDLLLWVSIGGGFWFFGGKILLERFRGREE